MVINYLWFLDEKIYIKLFEVKLDIFIPAIFLCRSLSNNDS